MGPDAVEQRQELLDAVAQLPRKVSNRIRPIQIVSEPWLVDGLYGRDLVGCMVDFHWGRSVGTARNCSPSPPQDAIEIADTLH